VKIDVEPPMSDARRERVERRVFEQLAAVRMLDRTDAVLPAPERPRPRWILPSVGVMAAAAIAIVLLATRGGDAPSPPLATAPSRVITPPGGASQFMVGQDVVNAGSDTSVEVQQDSSGVTLTLARGSVECDVEPRPGRLPFHVISGDVAIEVVGTHFTVTRTPAPRVDVARGKVKVTAPGGTWLVSAGESWPAVPVTAAADVTASPEPVVEPEKTSTSTSTSTSTTKKPGKHELSADALINRIEANLTGNPRLAVKDADEFLRRFPTAREVQDVTFSKIQALHNAGDVTAVRRAADDYLKQFPHGIYRDSVSAIAAQK
jgi:hypothetical protein